MHRERVDTITKRSCIENRIEKGIDMSKYRQVHKIPKLNPDEILEKEQQFESIEDDWEDNWEDERIPEGMTEEEWKRYLSYF